MHFFSSVYSLMSSTHSVCLMVFAGGSDGNESAYNAGDSGSISGSGRSPGEGKGCPLQYSRLENSMDRGVWRATVHGVTKSWTQLSDYHSLQSQVKKQQLELDMDQQTGSKSRKEYIKAA